MFVLHGAAPFRTRAPEANKKSPRPHRAFTLQGREPENFRGTTLFYRTLTGTALKLRQWELSSAHTAYSRTL